jgi:eukaryotic-like serine/threonine-protein kinase
MDPLVARDPRRVGPHDVLGRLGAGGMGTVLPARSRTGSLVAVKVVHEQLAHDQGFRARFAREIVAARRVSGLYTAGRCGRGEGLRRAFCDAAHRRMTRPSDAAGEW